MRMFTTRQLPFRQSTDQLTKIVIIGIGGRRRRPENLKVQENLRDKKRCTVESLGPCSKTALAYPSFVNYGKGTKDGQRERATVAQFERT